MQQDINHMVSWTQRMGVRLNEAKVHILHLGQNNPRRPYNLGEGGPIIEVVEQEKDLGVLVSSDMKPDKMVSSQVQKAHLKLTQFNSTFTYRGSTWIKLYKTYVKPSLLYACEAWRPTSQAGINKLEGVQRRAIRMAGGLGEGSYRDACRKSGMNMIEEELEVTDMTRVFRIMYGHDKVDKSNFWRMEGAGAGPGRRRFKEKEVTRTLSIQRKEVRKRSFASRVQDQWNSLDDSVKKVRNPKLFRNAFKKAKNLV